jgi:hypothetical protein
LVPGWAVYYLDYMCQKHPEMDSAYAEFLSEDLKSSSGQEPADIKKPKKKDEFVEILQSATQQMQENQEQGNKYQEETLQLQREELSMRKEAEETRRWNEYSDLYQRLEQLQESNNPNQTMIQKVGPRVLVLGSFRNKFLR